MLLQVELEGRHAELAHQCNRVESERDKKQQLVEEIQQQLSESTTQRQQIEGRQKALQRHLEEAQVRHVIPYK